MPSLSRLAVPMLLLVGALSFAGLYLVMDQEERSPAGVAPPVSTSAPTDTWSDTLDPPPVTPSPVAPTVPSTPSTSSTSSTSSGPSISSTPIPEPPTPTAPVERAEQTSPAAAAPTVLPGAQDPVVEPDGDPVDPGAPAVPRGARQAARFAGYEQVAGEFMTVFARPAGGPASTWWDQVSPYLSEQARSAYQRVDPAAVPFTKVTGPPVVVPTDAPSDLLMVVLVPTDAGDYQVEMQTDESGIHVTRVVPPQQQARIP